MNIESKSEINFSEGLSLMEVRPKSLVEAMVEETADSTVAFNLQIVRGRKEKGNSRQAVARQVWAATTGLYFGYKEMGVPLLDNEGRVGVALPNTNIEMPSGLGSKARPEAQVSAGRVKDTLQRALLYQAVLAAESRGKRVDFEAFSKEFGLPNAESVREELKRIRAEVMPKQMGELTAVLWDPEGVGRGKKFTERLSSVLHRFTTRSANFAPTEQIFEIPEQEQAVDKQKVVRNLVLVGMGGLALAACSSPGFAGSEGSPVPKPSEIVGNGGENVPGTGGEEEVTPTEEAPTETPPAKPTATSEPTETPTPEPSPTPTATEIPTFSEEQLAKMNDKEKLAAVPEEVEGYTKSNVSTVKGNLVIYRDSQGQAEMVYDLTTGESMTLKEAGIVEFNLKKTEMYTPREGEKIELLAFENAKEAFKYIVYEGYPLRDGDPYAMSFTSDNHGKLTDEQILAIIRTSSIEGVWGSWGAGVEMSVPAYLAHTAYEGDEVPFRINIAGERDLNMTMLRYLDEGHKVRVVMIYDQDNVELYELLSKGWSGDDYLRVKNDEELKNIDPEKLLVPPQPED